MKIEGKLVVVTGVSKGIGLASAELLLSKGMIVVGWSRTAPPIKHERFHFYATDVGDIESVNASYNQTVKHHGDVHALINNAGLGYMGAIDQMPVEEWTEMFNTNVNGLFYCSQMVIPRMREMGEGYIINIASIAGQQGIENMSGYCGTKFAVRGISQAMYKEVRDYGVKVTCICPGSVQTNFFDQIEAISVNENMMKASDIAESILYCFQTSDNFHPVELEVRPLMPKGKKVVSE